MRAVTRKHHDQRQADPPGILPSVVSEPFPPYQLWPFLLDYLRIEATPRTINEEDKHALAATGEFRAALQRTMSPARPGSNSRADGRAGCQDHNVFQACARANAV
jgi:hypothetical protein